MKIDKMPFKKTITMQVEIETGDFTEEQINFFVKLVELDDELGKSLARVAAAISVVKSITSEKVVSTSFINE